MLSPTTEARTSLAWLHLSDFHSKVIHSAEQKQVTDSLLERLAVLRENLASEGKQRFWPIDFVFFSGDLAHSGAADEYIAVNQFLSDLGELLNLGPERFIIVPGNHDVDRSKGADGVEIVIDPKDPIHAAKRLFQNEKLMHYLHGKFLNYADLKTQYPNCLDALTCKFFTQVLELAPFKIGIILANTAWLCQKSDYPGKLLVDGYGFEETLTKLHRDNDGINSVFLVMHHAPAWLHPSESETVSKALGSVTGVDAVILGHDHRLDPRLIDAAGDALYLKGGALFEPQSVANVSPSNNVCTICRCEPGSGLIEVLPLVRKLPTQYWCIDRQAFPWEEDGIAKFYSRRRQVQELELAQTETVEIASTIHESIVPGRAVGMVYIAGDTESTRKKTRVVYRCVSGNMAGNSWTNATWETRFSQTFPYSGALRFSVDVHFVDGSNVLGIEYEFDPTRAPG